MMWPSGMVLMGVALGGALGALLRFGAVWLETGGKGSSRFPWATIAVNNVGAALLGLGWAAGLAGAVEAVWALALAVGVCGSLTTFSSFAVQAEQFWQSERWGGFGLNLLLSAGGPLLLLWLGLRVGSLVF